MHIVCSAVPGAPPQSGQLTMQQVLVGVSRLPSGEDSAALFSVEY